MILLFDSFKFHKYVDFFDIKKDLHDHDSCCDFLMDGTFKSATHG